MKNIAYSFLIISCILASCQNEEWEFPNYDYQTVYFAHQSPVRTITLGEDIFDTSMDNEGKFRIMATTGGVYRNESDVLIDIVVDNSLVEGMEFYGTGNDILPMPDSYYTLASNTIVIPEGEVVGGVEVQLTDAFFADPLSIGTNYVIPVRMTEVTNADSILSGVAGGADARRGVGGDWAIQPKDYVFYAVKYINPWEGIYLRRGEEVIVGKNGNTELDTVIVRQADFVENDVIAELETAAFNQVTYPLIFRNAEGENIYFSLLLNFAEDGSFTVASNTENVTASGSGKFVKDGEKNSWGGVDRDAVYLDYEIEFDEFLVSSTDTLVLRNRGVTMELFEPVLNQ